jgi:hypothetical protein
MEIDDLHGFFANLEHDMNSERKELRFVLDQNGSLFSSIVLHLGEWSVHEGVQRIRDEAKKRAGSLVRVLLTKRLATRQSLYRASCHFCCTSA